ncbi:MAG: SGNH/GDSL hydrolase family protein [Phycisphaerae bacterium]|nr:SGNH/GDSL hydrolase family protein [Phycisphaerae bacterium]
MKKIFGFMMVLVLSFCLVGCGNKTVKRVGPAKVLIIGDSISIGYKPFVKEMLKDEAIVARPGDLDGYSVNCGPTERGVENIDKWLGDHKWDVIHFNWGLWDLCYRHPESKVQGNRDKVNGKITATPEEYAANLEKLVARLKQTNAKLIWGTISMVPEGEAGRFVGDDIKYNKAAEAVMKRNGVAINDIWEVTSKLDKEYFIGPGNVHYKPEGYKIIAEQVAKEIRKALKSK